MLRACALQFRGDWDEKLPLMEFAYNDSCQTSIEMSPIDALHGKQCRTPLYEDEVEEQPVELEADFTYVEQPVQILNWKRLACRERAGEPE
ncbi:hypothetical protein L3X38_037777 [Prunus dulcis]|uniref:Transposable element protein n=1 Tax=Prunus dulcis TaxID=3755 RepID=A0AAD4YR04_PRUDU|nr:hypothetical protein L3X38_037777 [Prunus dulcis]